MITKGVDEPYRMFTSRAEYRILLRQDDADFRLTEKAYKLGLASEKRFRMMKSKRESVDNLISFCSSFSIKPAFINSFLEKTGTTALRKGCKLIDLINRPQISLTEIAEHIAPLMEELNKIEVKRKDEIIEEAELMMKYSGYIARERAIAEKMKRLENINIKGMFNYQALQSISTEARQKLEKVNPDTLAQASRIPGVSPSDINVLLVLLNR